MCGETCKHGFVGEGGEAIPHSTPPNWLWFAYRITDGVETRERIGFTGACRRGQLVSRPVWNTEIQNKDGVLEAIEIKADSPGSLRLLRTVCSKGYSRTVPSK